MDSGAGVTKHTGAMIVRILKLVVDLQTGATEMLSQCITETCFTSRKQKETLDIKSLWGIFSKSQLDNNLLDS